MVSTASTVRRPGQPLRASRVGSLGAGEHAPADQAAMAVVEGVNKSARWGAAAEAVLLEMLSYSRIAPGGDWP